MDDNQIKNHKTFKKFKIPMAVLDDETLIKLFRKSQLGKPASKRTWHAHLNYWDISNGIYQSKSIVIGGYKNIPSIDDLAKDLNFEVWVEKSEKGASIPYVDISKKWFGIKYWYEV